MTKHAMPRRSFLARSGAAAALAAGASKLVIGRPITGAEDPVAAFDAICAEVMA